MKQGEVECLENQVHNFPENPSYKVGKFDAYVCTKCECVSVDKSKWDKLHENT